MHRLSIFLAAGMLFSFCKKSDGDLSGSGSSGSAGATAYQTSAQIGAAGGTIADPNGNWSLTIPAGALTQTKNITITTNAAATGSIPSDYTGTTATLSFEPHGLTFLSPATLKIKYAQGDMVEGGIEERMQKQYYINDDSKVVAMSSTVNAATNEITAQVPHFSFSASLTSSIKKVNNGTTTRPSSVRKIANRVIAYFNALASDAARNAEFQANAALLNAFIAKLAQILGSDILTAAFPNADFNNNGIPNSADPLIVTGGANVTLTSSGSLYVSTNAGAIASTQFVWRSSASGSYVIRLNGTNCSNGSTVQSGAVTLNVDNTLNGINASSLISGDNEYRVCVTVGGTTTFLLVVIARDEIYPVSSANPAGGTYATAQNVSMDCLDAGAADCAQIAYTTNGTDPAFDAAGNVTNGTLYSAMWALPAVGVSTLRVISRDDAGNVGVIATYNFTPAYSVVYDGNGNTSGTVPIDANGYTQGASATASGNTGSLIKSGFLFSGWNSQADGSGTGYTPGATFALGTGSTTLYAKWISPANRFWGGITGSVDGTKLAAFVVAGQIYTSVDSGVTWTARESNRSWGHIGSAANASILVAPVLSGQIQISADWGVTWAPFESNRSWECVTVSNDGTKLAAGVAFGQLYTSTDSGSLWTPRESNRNWRELASSADGSKLAAAVYGGQIYTSTDSGVTWVARETNRNWQSITVSGDGTKMAAVSGGAIGGLIYTSTDSGATWTARGSSQSWTSIASSNDGTKLIASAAQIYISSDSGLTWSAKNVTGSGGIPQVTISGDGTKMAAVANGGMIYTSSDSGVTWIPRY